MLSFAGAGDFISLIETCLLTQSSIFRPNMSSLFDGFLRKVPQPYSILGRCVRIAPLTSSELIDFLGLQVNVFPTANSLGLPGDSSTKVSARPNRPSSDEVNQAAISKGPGNLTSQLSKAADDSNHSQSLDGPQDAEGGSPRIQHYAGSAAHVNANAPRQVPVLDSAAQAASAPTVSTSAASSTPSPTAHEPAEQAVLQGGKAACSASAFAFGQPGLPKAPLDLSAAQPDSGCSKSTPVPTSEQPPAPTQEAAPLGTGSATPAVPTFRFGQTAAAQTQGADRATPGTGSASRAAFAFGQPATAQAPPSATTASSTAGMGAATAAGPTFRFGQPNAAGPSTHETAGAAIAAPTFRFGQPSAARPTTHATAGAATAGMGAVPAAPATFSFGQAAAATPPVHTTTGAATFGLGAAKASPAACKVGQPAAARAPSRQAATAGNDPAQPADFTSAQSAAAEASSSGVATSGTGPATSAAFQPEQPATVQASSSGAATAAKPAAFRPGQPAAAQAPSNGAATAAGTDAAAAAPSGFQFGQSASATASAQGAAAAAAPQAFSFGQGRSACRVNVAPPEQTTAGATAPGTKPRARIIRRPAQAATSIGSTSAAFSQPSASSSAGFTFDQPASTLAPQPAAPQSSIGASLHQGVLPAVQAASVAAVAVSPSQPTQAGGPDSTLTWSVVSAKCQLVLSSTLKLES